MAEDVCKADNLSCQIVDKEGYRNARCKVLKCGTEGKPCDEDNKCCQDYICKNKACRFPTNAPTPSTVEGGPPSVDGKVAGGTGPNLSDKCQAAYNECWKNMNDTPSVPGVNCNLCTFNIPSKTCNGSEKLAMNYDGCCNEMFPSDNSCRPGTKKGIINQDPDTTKTYMLSTGQFCNGAGLGMGLETFEQAKTACDNNEECACITNGQSDKLFTLHKGLTIQKARKPGTIAYLKKE